VKKCASDNIEDVVISLLDECLGHWLSLREVETEYKKMRSEWRTLLNKIDNETPKELHKSWLR